MVGLERADAKREKNTELEINNTEREKERGEGELQRKREIMGNEGKDSGLRGRIVG